MAEELVPVVECGVLELNRNVENFFAETEQAAFHPGNLVTGIEASNDPLLQGRLFSYTDTQMYRLNTPNFQDLPINRPVAEVHNNQRDGYGQHRIHTAKTNYTNNSRMGNAPSGCPFHNGGYKEAKEALKGFKTKARPEKFLDFYTQPKLFYDSLAPWEQQHLKDAIKFELTKCKEEAVRQQVVNVIAKVDKNIADEIADYLGLKVQQSGAEYEDDKSGDKYNESEEFKYEGKKVEKSDALSMDKQPKKPDTLNVGVMILEGYDKAEVDPVIKAMKDAGMYVNLVSDHLGNMTVAGEEMAIKEAFNTTDAVLHDAIYLAGLDNLDAKFRGNIRNFIDDMFTYYKPLIVSAKDAAYISDARRDEPGILIGDTDGAYKDKVVDFITEMRYWDRDITK